MREDKRTKRRMERDHMKGKNEVREEGSIDMMTERKREGGRKETKCSKESRKGRRTEKMTNGVNGWRKKSKKQRKEGRKDRKDWKKERRI